MKNEVAIIGGGLAGLTAAIHLSKIGIAVTVFEKNQYPKHKVCGEYISNEVLPYFNWLNLDIECLYPARISKLEFSIANGKSIKCALPLGGFGISRYVLDNYLYEKAVENGCVFLKQSVNNIFYESNIFTITTADNNTFYSKMVIGAFGKRSNIDQTLNRSFMFQKTSWLAVKCHYSGNFPNDLVGLHNFEGGYCGVSKVENNIINVCYLANYETFKKYKNVAIFENNVVIKNPHLKAIFEQSSVIFEKPISIGQISFAKKTTVENHIVMIGDTAGLIHPLCGNGMAMAIHSAKIASESIADFFDGKYQTRAKFEKEYSKKWNFNFKNRLQIGRLISAVLQKPFLAQFLLNFLIVFPKMLPILIKKTHGKTL